jgi:hypothetical protein
MLQGPELRRALLELLRQAQSVEEAVERADLFFALFRCDLVNPISRARD